MTTEEYELCTTICRGMIHRAMTNPHQTFMDGMKGFAEDRKQKKKETENKIKETMENT